MLSGTPSNATEGRQPGLTSDLKGHRVNVLGVGISAINMDQALEAIDHWIRHREQRYITVTPAHSVMECLRDSNLRELFNRSGLTTPDGMSLVWLLRMKGHRHVGRVYGPDLLLAVCKRSQMKDYRHYFYGGGPGVAEALVASLQKQFPSLHTVGAFSPPFGELTPDEDAEITKAINAGRPNIVWVGIGTPKQERWMAAHIGRIEAPVLIGIGAAFDFLSGRKPQAPRWMQRTGLEWLFRLATEPRRLWPRYRQYPLFVLLVLAQMLGLRTYPMSVQHVDSFESRSPS